MQVYVSDEGQEVNRDRRVKLSVNSLYGHHAVLWVIPLGQLLELLTSLILRHLT